MLPPPGDDWPASLPLGGRGAAVVSLPRIAEHEHRRVGHGTASAVERRRNLRLVRHGADARVENAREVGLAAREREAAHADALKAQAALYERRIDGLHAQLCGLASDVRALCRDGRWPGGAAAANAVEHAASECAASEQIDAGAAYLVLCAAIRGPAGNDRSLGRPPGP